MADVVFLVQGVEKRRVKATPGTSIMELARESDVDGILAMCGGSCSCATCHVYVQPDSLSLFPPASTEEQELLTGVTSECRPNSRLSCQLVIRELMPDIVVEVPDNQT